MENRIPRVHVYDGMNLPSNVPVSSVERVKALNLDPGDTFIVSYPKTGTTWLQEMAWLVVNDGDVELANQSTSMSRVPYVEVADPSDPNNALIDVVQHIKRPRVVKSHLPVRYFTRQLSDDNVKFLVSIRNPKDTFVSFYHFYRSNKMLGNFTGTWDEFFGQITDDKLIYGSYFDWYADWWAKSTKDNVHFVNFEDMKKDLRAEITKIADFLGKVLPGDVIDRIAQHGEFEAMKENKMTNRRHVPSEYLNQDISPFMRSGQVGDWKHYFTEEQSDLVNAMYDRRMRLKGLELEFE